MTPPSSAEPMPEPPKWDTFVVENAIRDALREYRGVHTATATIALDGALARLRWLEGRHADASRHRPAPAGEACAYVSDPETGVMCGVCGRAKGAHAAHALVSLADALAAVDAEPELPGPMPDKVYDLWKQNIKDRAWVEGAQRVAVTSTKDGIRDRIKALRTAPGVSAPPRPRSPRRGRRREYR